MKKSQILAALALAFALGLGVVAPVANTYAAERAYQGGSATNTATEAEVKGAATTVKTDVKYAAYVATEKAYTEANALGAGAEISTSALISTLSSLNVSTAVTGTLYEQATALIRIATGVTNYSEWENLMIRITEANALVASGTDSQKAEAKTNLISAINAISGVPTFVDDGESLSDVITAASNATVKDANGNNTVYTYGRMSALINAVNAQVKTTTAAANLKSALLAVAAAMPTATSADRAAQTSTIDAINAAFNGNAPVVNLKGRAWGLTTNPTTASAFIDLKGAVAGIDATNFNQSSAANNYSMLTDLKAFFKTFAGYDLEDSKPVQNPENPDNKPEDGDKPGDNNGDDQKDPSAPGTGVLSSADGNAATTVSIVAGLATALTALGAGVVAYRSARRSNK